MQSSTIKPTEPQAMEFGIPCRGKARFFLRNNPWKISQSDNNIQKIFRYCIICGANRFTDEEWEGKLSGMDGKLPLTCLDCTESESLQFLNLLIPEKYYLVQTSEDKQRIPDAYTNEFVNTINPDDFFF